MFSRDPYYEPLVWFMIAFIKNQPFPSRYAAVYMHISYILNSYFLQTLHAFR